MGEWREDSKRFKTGDGIWDSKQTVLKHVMPVMDDMLVRWIWLLLYSIRLNKRFRVDQDFQVPSNHLVIFHLQSNQMEIIQDITLGTEPQPISLHASTNSIHTSIESLQQVFQEVRKHQSLHFKSTFRNGPPSSVWYHACWNLYLYIITYSFYELVHPMHDIRKGFYEVRKRRTSWLYLRFSIRMSVGLRMRRFSWSVKISL